MGNTRYRRYSTSGRDILDKCTELPDGGVRVRKHFLLTLVERASLAVKHHSTKPLALWSGVRNSCPAFERNERSLAAAALRWVVVDESIGISL